MARRADGNGVGFPAPEHQGVPPEASPVAGHNTKREKSIVFAVFVRLGTARGARGRKSEMNDLFALAPVLLQSLM